MTAPARLSAFVIAIAAAVALWLQVIVSHDLTGSAGATLWVILGYFTILTNLIVFATFARMALTGRMLSPGWLAGVTLWIAIVGVVYHALLASIWEPQGLALRADQGLHTVTPILTLAFWLVFAPKDGLGVMDAVRWLGWPLIYVIYALIRGIFTQTYPYPFIDLNVLTPGQVAVNAVGLTVAFFIGGLVFVGLGRVLK
ncbi:MAG: Pr6Pr family membrane protein [Pseudomonadota bacterium]|nr:Pr6Pr family membrane protein [Pseudomonadota bacterium]